MQVTRYAMCNSAMAAMAYNESIIDDNFTTPDTDSDEETRLKFGLAKKIPASTTIINFALPADAALGQWSANNQYFKPQIFAAGDFYVYTPSFAPGSKLRYVGPGYWNDGRNITSVPEAMAYVTQSRSRAAGAKLGLAEGNDSSVSSTVNMGAGEFNFGTEHSAEWNWTIQRTRLFWREVLTQFQIDTGDH